MVESTLERMERRFRRGGLVYLVVGGLAAVYAVVLHAGFPQPPTYGLASAYVLDWLGRLADRIFPGSGWEETAFRINLGVAGAVAGLGMLCWLGSRINRLFSVFGILPRLGSRLLYLAGMAFYLFDGLVAVGVEITFRKMHSVEGFALTCIIVHLVFLLALLYGFTTGLYGLRSGVVELFRFVVSPRQYLRAARGERPADHSPAPTMLEDDLDERLRRLAEGDP